MRKQQLRMDSGGAVVRARRREFGWVSVDWSTTSILRNTSVNAAAIKGCTCGIGGLSRDWFPAWSLAWQRLGCALSAPAHPLIARSSSMDMDIDTDSSACPIFKFGQAYPATASCMNSMLTSTMHAVIKRDERKNFMVYRFLLNS